MFLHLGAGLVPSLTILATTTQISVGANASLVEHGKWGARVAEARVHRHVEASVTIEEHGALTVFLQTLLVNEKHGNLGAVLAGIKHLFGHVVVGIKGDGGLEELA